MSTFLGTRYATAPEVLEHKNYSAKADSWSLGVILYIMVLGKV